MNFNIEYTTDDGVSWNLIDSGIEANSYGWKLLKVKPLLNYLIRITGYDSDGVIVGSDISDSSFTIQY